MKKIILLLFTLAILVTPLAASAQFGAATGKLDAVAGKTGLTNSFEGSVSAVITGVLSLAGTIFLLLTVYAGILWMTAQGNEEQVTKAKGIVTQAIIGLAITMGAYAITAFVTGKLSSGGSSGGASSPSANLGGSGGGSATGQSCAKQGGACINIVSGQNPCDPPGLDNYSGGVLSGSCQTANQSCCELDASVEKCNAMDGQVLLGSCVKGVKFVINTNVGQNNNCCNK